MPSDSTPGSSDIVADQQQDGVREAGDAPWLQPPPLTIGAIFPMNREMARTSRGVVSLVEVRAYRTGCSLECVAALRSPSDAGARQRFWQVIAGLGVDPDRPPPELIRFGVRYGDGSGTTTLQSPRRTERTDREGPAVPGLVVRSGRAAYDTSGRWLQVVFILWLWPLPPPENFLLDVEYPLIDVARTGIELDGSAIATAGADARMLVE